jgi:hypothetical protein
MNEDTYKQGLFWNYETLTFQRWEDFIRRKECQKESQETFQERTKNI